jgi:transcriptional regulator with XRE-family HTH domain
LVATVKGAALKLPRLKEVRELHGWSQKKLAEEADVSRDSISNYETGHREAWPGTAGKLADALGVEIADLAKPAEELAGAGKGKAPREAGLTDVLTAKINEVQQRYGPRRYGLEKFCEHWERQLASLGENLDRGTLDEMTVVGTCVTEFFVQAAVEETVEIWATLASAEPEVPIADNSKAAETAARISIMRPVLVRWERLGNEIYRRGVEKFGEDVARGAIEIGPVDDLARRRAENLRRAS